MTIHPENTLLMPGLWFNGLGPLTEKIQDQGYKVLDGLTGLPCQEQRILALLDHLDQHPEIKNLIGHSAGCITIIEALRLHHVRKHLSKVILMNSGPLEGTYFMPWDPLTGATLKYVRRLLEGKGISLAKADAMNILGEDVDMKDLSPDSGVFIRSILMKQLPWKKPDVAHLRGVDVTSVFAGNDRILGSTAQKTAGQLGKFGPVKRIGKGHMWTLHHLGEVLELVGEPHEQYA